MSKHIIVEVSMLLPRTSIFVVYGHRPHLLNATLQTIEKAASEGYRVKSEVLDEATLSAEKATSIYEALRRRMGLADAAIVIATADDLGERRSVIEKAAADKAEPLQKLLRALKPRARQNVILELGMLLNQVGDQRLLILVDRESEPPSDLVGRFWDYIETEDDAIARIRRFIKQTARKTSLNLLSEQSQHLDYSDLRYVGDLPLVTFTNEFEKLEAPEDKALYLTERLVFDSYIQNPAWWRAKLDEIPLIDSRSLVVTHHILSCIMSYMWAWMPLDRTDYHEIELVCQKLDEWLRSLDTDAVPLNPAVLIAAYDYLGLAKNKAARAPWLEMHAERLLREALEAFDKCLSLAAKYDDRAFDLWRGYALFNRARSVHDLMNRVNGTEKERLKDVWKAQIMESIQIRRRWRDKSADFSLVIQDGLTTEYFHAVAERILRAEQDDRGHIREKGPFSINDQWVEEKRKEFREWWDNPTGLRVRLAINVRDHWKKIEEGVVG